MTSLHRASSRTKPSAARSYTWLPVVTTLAILGTILILALTGNEAAAAATATLGAATGTVQITVHVRR
ncbi:hypothetical protein ACWDV7_23265 [Streptomyces sp. NPDC003362]